MRMLGLLGLTGVLLVWLAPVRAGDAIVLKASSYQTIRAGYPMPKRILRIGTIVKVLATHGTKADVATSTGDNVSVRLANLRLLPDPPPAPLAFSLAAVPTPAPPVSLPSPVPSPVPNSGTPEKASAPAPAPPKETAERPAAVRCSHVLKDGRQCSRMTTNPNGLCWQHGGD